MGGKQWSQRADFVTQKGTPRARKPEGWDTPKGYDPDALTDEEWNWLRKNAAGVKVRNRRAKYRAPPIGMPPRGVPERRRDREVSERAQQRARSDLRALLATRDLQVSTHPKTTVTDQCRGQDPPKCWLGVPGMTVRGHPPECWACTAILVRKVFSTHFLLSLKGNDDSYQGDAEPASAVDHEELDEAGRQDWELDGAVERELSGEGDDV